MVHLPKYQELPGDVRKKSTIRGIIYATVPIVFFVAIEISLYVLIENKIYKSRDQEYRFHATQIADRFESLLNQLKMEFQILANSEVARKCLHEHETGTCNDAASLMKTMAENNENVDNIRLIDSSGHEIVRVHRPPDGIARTAKGEKLRSKRHRNYFTHTMRTDSGEIYISKLELNKKHGRVEIPYKPILRFGKSIRNTNNNPIGIAIANYRVTSLLRETNAAMTRSEGHLFLLNEEGYYLQGAKPKDEYSFIFPDRYPVGFFSDYPDEWKQFTENLTQTVTNRKGVFFFKRISFKRLKNTVSPENSLILVIHTPQGIRVASTELLTFGLATGAVLLIPLIAMLGWKNGRYHVLQEWYISELTSKSFTDDLTGVLNHRGVMKTLAPVIDTANHENSPFVLIFVDINDLKIFNDEMGHEMGDRLIQTAAHAMLQAVRKSDVVGRLGGDEFVLGLVDCNTPMAISVMQRVDSTLEEAGVNTTGTPWTMSWGYTEREADDTPEQMIARADRRMYRQKSAHKTGRHRIQDIIAESEMEEVKPSSQDIS